MQNPTTFLPNNQPRIVGELTPEIQDALRLARAVEYDLAAEYFTTDWGLRDRLARDLHDVAKALPESFASVALSVARDLNDEDADFEEWGSRLDASRRIHRLTLAVERTHILPEPEEDDDEALEALHAALEDDDRREAAHA